MSVDLDKLLEQRAEIEKQIAAARRAERADAIARVKALMTEHGLTMADLTARAPTKSPEATKRKVAPKYRDASTGDTWTGRGLQPKWLRHALANGRQLSDFMI